MFCTNVCTFYSTSQPGILLLWERNSTWCYIVYWSNGKLPGLSTLSSTFRPSHHWNELVSLNAVAISPLYSWHSCISQCWGILPKHTTWWTTLLKQLNRLENVCRLEKRACLLHTLMSLMVFHWCNTMMWFIWRRKPSLLLLHVHVAVTALVFVPVSVFDSGNCLCGVLAALTELGSIAFKQEQYDEAADMYVGLHNTLTKTSPKSEALARGRQYFDGIVTASVTVAFTVCDNMGVCYMESSQLDKAEEAFLQSLRIKTGLFPEGDETISTSETKCRDTMLLHC